MWTAFVYGVDATKLRAAVHPPLREMGALRELPVEPGSAEGLRRAPAERRPRLERWIGLRDPERLEQEARDAQEEEDAEEGPSPDHVPAAILLPVRPPVVEPERLADALDGEDEEARQE